MVVWHRYHRAFLSSLWLIVGSFTRHRVFDENRPYIGVRRRLDLFEMSSYSHHRRDWSRLTERDPPNSVSSVGHLPVAYCLREGEAVAIASDSSWTGAWAIADAIDLKIFKQVQ